MGAQADATIEAMSCASSPPTMSSRCCRAASASMNTSCTAAHWDHLGRDAARRRDRRVQRRSRQCLGGRRTHGAGAIVQPHAPAPGSIHRIHRLHRRRRLACSAREYYVEHPVFPLRAHRGCAQSRPAPHRRTHPGCDGVRRRQLRARGVRSRNCASAGPREVTPRSSRSLSRDCISVRISFSFAQRRRARTVREIGAASMTPLAARNGGRRSTRIIERTATGRWATNIRRTGTCAARWKISSYTARSDYGWRIPADSRAGFRTASSA